MKTVLRVLAVLLAFPAIFYFVFWSLPPVLSPAGPPVVRIAVALLPAIAGAWFVWRALGSGTIGPLGAAVLGAILGGAAGFIAGFVGPMIIAPGANQAPMLGIFVTGPLGLVIGALVGFFRQRARRPG